MSQELKEKISQAVWENKLPVFLATVGVLLIIVSIGMTLFSPQEPEITFKEPFESTTASASAIMVDIEGAVVKPGVYSLPLGSRLKDGLIMAGGLSASADREKIAKSMNLAARLTDGAKVYFPKQGEISSTVNTQSGVVSSSDVSTLININEASEGQLDTLYGVGPATAQKIIGGRPYSDIQELLTKKIVSRSVFDKIKDRISIN